MSLPTQSARSQRRAPEVKVERMTVTATLNTSMDLELLSKIPNAKLVDGDKPFIALKFPSGPTSMIYPVSQRLLCVYIYSSRLCSLGGSSV
jgi:hypothetical protein